MNRRVRIFLRLKREEVGAFLLDTVYILGALALAAYVTGGIASCMMAIFPTEPIERAIALPIFLALYALPLTVAALYYTGRWLRANWVEAGRLAELEESNE